MGSQNKTNINQNKHIKKANVYLYCYLVIILTCRHIYNMPKKTCLLMCLCLHDICLRRLMLPQVKSIK